MKRTFLALALALSALAAPSAMAQSDLGLKGLGVAIGYVGPEGIDGTFSVGVLADHGTITPNIGLESHLDYWGQSESAFGAEASVRDIAIGTRAKYNFDVSSPKIRPFLGAGLGLHFVHAEVTVPSQFGFPGMTVEDSSTKFGLDLGGGMATPLGSRAELLAELWYGIVSDVSQLSLRFGVCHPLGS